MASWALLLESLGKVEFWAIGKFGEIDIFGKGIGKSIFGHSISLGRMALLVKVLESFGKIKCLGQGLGNFLFLAKVLESLGKFVFLAMVSGSLRGKKVVSGVKVLEGLGKVIFLSKVMGSLGKVFLNRALESL